LAVIERPWTPVIPADEDQLRLRRNRAKFVTLAVVKLVAGAGAVGLAAWTEFLLQVLLLAKFFWANLWE
jgi:hypothetical protein